jgi:antigen flippase
LSKIKSILKSTLITGGGQAVVMILNILRTKALALFLGPAGTGIIGLLTSTTSLISSVSSLGINSSAVREIARSNKDEDKLELRKTLFVFRWLIRVTGLLGALCLFFMANYFSIKAFGDVSKSSAFRWLSAIILLGSFTNGQYGLLQGLRKIKELALAKIIGVSIGTVVSIGLIYFLREEGIVPSIIIGSVTTVALSWYFVRKQGLPSERVGYEEFIARARTLITLGIAFLVSGLTATATAYYSRIFIADVFSIKELGIYTACWTLSAVYVQFILSAMGADFYPRLTELIDDHKSSMDLINQQTLIGLLMAATGIVGVVSFSGVVLELFYSSEFTNGFKNLQWMTLGMALKVVFWPLGFVIVCQNKMKTFVAVEILWGLLYIALLHLLTNTIGYEGVGIAFFITHFIYGFIVMILAKKAISFRWTKEVIMLIVFIGLLLAWAITSTRFLSLHVQYISGTILVLLTFWMVVVKFQSIFGISIIQFIRRKITKKN